MTSTPMQSESIDQLATALCLAQSQIQGASKDKDNPFFKSKYSDLTSVWEACKVHLTSNGLCVIQTVEVVTNDCQVLVTRLCHKSGQWVKGCMLLSPKTKDMQGYVAATTYARRVCLASIVGVVPEDPDLKDDDGNKACGKISQDPKFVTSVQASAITELCKRYADPADLVKQMCAWQACKSIAELPASQYDEVMGWLRDNLAK